MHLTEHTIMLFSSRLAKIGVTGWLRLAFAFAVMVIEAAARAFVFLVPTRFLLWMDRHMLNLFPKGFSISMFFLSLLLACLCAHHYLPIAPMRTQPSPSVFAFSCILCVFSLKLITLARPFSRLLPCLFLLHLHLHLHLLVLILCLIIHGQTGNC